MPIENEKKSSSKGCLLYGCLTLVVLAILLLLGGYFTARYMVNTAINNFTDDAPIVFEEIVITDAERADLKERVDEFNSAKGKTNQPVELVLSSDEINALIDDDPDKPELSDNFRINIEDGKLIAKASIPLEQFSDMFFLSRLKDRHLNANVHVGVELEDGVAAIDIESAEVNGQPLPPEIIDALKKEMAFENLMNDPKVREKLDQIDSIRVEDGKLRISTGGSE